MALEGNLSDFSLADMFRLLETGSKTGALHVSAGETDGVVCFKDGLVYYAHAGVTGEPAGKRLVKAGAISDKQLRQAQGLMKIQKRDKAKRRLGQILVDEGYVEASVLEGFVLDAVADALFDLLRWEEGDLRFEPDEELPDADIGIYVPIDSALADANKRLEAWIRIREKIPSLDTRFAMAASPGTKSVEIHLKPREWMLLCYLHGGRERARACRADRLQRLRDRADPLRNVCGRADREGRRGRRDAYRQPMMDGSDALKKDLAPEEFQLFRDWIHHHSGIYLEDTKMDSLRISLVTRATRYGFTDYDDYFALLESDEDEFKELMNLVTINETSFFRFPAQFEAFRDHVIPEIMAGRSESAVRRFRVWSAGCSTGEEPYTIGMSLLDSALVSAGYTCEVVGTDVSTQALERARTGVYPARSVATLQQAGHAALVRDGQGGTPADQAGTQPVRVSLPQPDQGAVPARLHEQLGRHLLPQRHHLLQARVDSQSRAELLQRAQSRRLSLHWPF